MCSNTNYIEESGRDHDLCSETCAKQYQTGAQPHVVPQAHVVPQPHVVQAHVVLEPEPEPEPESEPESVPQAVLVGGPLALWLNHNGLGKYHDAVIQSYWDSLSSLRDSQDTPTTIAENIIGQNHDDNDDMELMVDSLKHLRGIALGNSPLAHWLNYNGFGKYHNRILLLGYQTLEKLASSQDTPDKLAENIVGLTSYDNNRMSKLLVQLELLKSDDYGEMGIIMDYLDLSDYKDSMLELGYDMDTLLLLKNESYTERDLPLKKEDVEKLLTYIRQNF